MPSATEPSRLIDAGLEQQGLVQRRLAGPAVADDRDVPDALCAFVRHQLPPLLDAQRTKEGF